MRANQSLCQFPDFAHGIGYPPGPGRRHSGEQLEYFPAAEKILPGAMVIPRSASSYSLMESTVSGISTHSTDPGRAADPCPVGERLLDRLGHQRHLPAVDLPGSSVGIDRNLR